MRINDDDDFIFMFETASFTGIQTGLCSFIYWNRRKEMERVASKQEKTHKNEIL